MTRSQLIGAYFNANQLNTDPPEPDQIQQVEFLSVPLDLSVVIPMLNEADNVIPLLEEVCTVLDDSLRYEIVVVDDGSTDETSIRIKELASHRPQIRIVRHRKNSGQSATIYSGVSAARAPWIATLDGDGQNDPADIPRLLQVIESKQQSYPLIVAGYRMNRKDDWLRRLSSRIANTVRSQLLHDDCPDTGCGLKLFGREDFLKLPFFDHMHRFLPALIRRSGGQVINIAVNHRPRLRGRSKYGVSNRLWVGIVDMLGVIWLNRRSCQAEIVNDIE